MIPLEKRSTNLPCFVVVYNSDKKQLEWAASYLALIDALQAYVKKWHTTGVAWNPKVYPSFLPPRSVYHS